MAVSVVIVNFNGSALLRDCLDGLEAQIRPADEVIVVDNGSTDGSIDLLARWYPWVRTIDLSENLGFAVANNMGIRAAAGEIIVLMNNDTVPSPGFIESLCAPLESSTLYSAAAGVMLFSTSPDSVATSGIEVFTDGLALDADVGREWRSLPDAKCVFGPSGGAAAFRRSVLDDVELFPEPFFLYLEDVDLAWRLRMRGHRTVSIRDAWVLHVYSATSGEGSPLKDYYLARNRAWTLVRCWPRDLWRLYWRSVLLYELAAFSHAIVVGKWSSACGRIDGWRTLGRLLGVRNLIQRRSTATTDELLYWMQSAQSVRDHLRVRQRIKALIDPARHSSPEQSEIRR